MPEQLVAVDQKRSRFLVEKDCRLFERYTCELPSLCQPASTWGTDESKWPGTIRNISLGGIWLELRRRFEPGTGLAIELPKTPGRDAYTVLAKVVHVRPLADGAWALGCSLLSELNEDEIGRLIRPGREETPASRPAAPPPTPPTPQKKTVSGVHCHLEIRPGTVLEYIINRVTVADPWPLPRGHTMTLRSANAKRPWALRAQVVRCERQKQGWVLQCRLAKQPTPEDILEAMARLNATS